jgi:aspartate carbamoyltransferase catalytic subunit
MASLFYEPSTRTNFSFQTAMLRLGGSVFGFSDPNSTSAAKGETLKDTIKMVSAYADVIVMRSPKEGAARAASLYSEVPVVNAGDGGHMHPTQTLADLTTISQYHGTLSGLNIGLCGDLKYGRTVHSLIKALSKFPGTTFYLISPRDLAVPDYMRDFMRAHGQKFYEVSSMESTLPILDVLYMTRIQRERFIDPLEYDRLKGTYVLTRSKLANAKPELLVMHPLPRVDEIALDVDDDPRAVYFEQARCGMFARMALLSKLVEQGRKKPAPVEIGSAPLCHNKNCITQSELYLPPLTKDVGGKCCCGYCDKEI